MSLPERIERAAESINVDWSPTRAAEEWTKLQARQRQARTRRIYAGTGGVVLAAAAAALLFVSSSPAEPANVAKFFGEVELSDESQVFQLAENTEVNVVRDTDEGRELELRGGSAHFDIAPQRGVFLIRAGAVNVEVLGTQFTVQREDGQVRVAVEEGRVAVSNRVNEVILGAGEEVTWSDQEPPAEVEDETTPQDETTIDETTPADAPTVEEPTAEHRGTRTPREDWRTLAEAGEYQLAYERLRSATPPTRVADLMLAADVARLSGHAREAVPYLTRVSRRSRDPRAPLASFTLGLLQMEQLGDPQSAARSFARTRQLRSVGPFVEDALAREVEANARAGRRAQARSLAEEYVERFPSGQRIGAVRRFGGLTP